MFSVFDAFFVKFDKALIFEIVISQHDYKIGLHESGSSSNLVADPIDVNIVRGVQ